VWSRPREGKEEGGVMVLSWWVRQERGGVEQMNETGESWCKVGRQEGGGVVVWSRHRGTGGRWCGGLEQAQGDRREVVWWCGVGTGGQEGGFVVVWSRHRGTGGRWCGGVE
jgi:hypothetical protein